MHRAPPPPSNPTQPGAGDHLSLRSGVGLARYGYGYVFCLRAEEQVLRPRSATACTVEYFVPQFSCVVCMCRQAQAAAAAAAGEQQQQQHRRRRTRAWQHRNMSSEADEGGGGWPSVRPSVRPSVEVRANLKLHAQAAR